MSVNDQTNDRSGFKHPKGRVCDQHQVADLLTPERDMTQILRIDVRGKESESSSRQLGDELLAGLQQQSAAMIRQRDLQAAAPACLSDAWIAASLTAEDQRDESHRRLLGESDELIAELQAADVLLITTPMHNFSVPGVLKAWIDQVCRAGLTFQYTADGPQGLLQGKQAYLVITTGGVPVDSGMDFLTPYLRQVLAFIGITDVTVIAADAMNIDAAASLAKARSEISQILEEAEAA